MKHPPRRLRRLLVAAGAVGALTLGALTALPTTNAMAATGCSVTYSTNSWSGGFTASVTVTNLGDAVSNWTLGFAFPDAGQRLTQGWSATWSQSGNAVTARSQSWNGSLATGASTNIGFNGSFTGANPSPTSFTLNGTVCTGSTTPTTPTPTTPPPTTPPPTNPPTTPPPPGTQTPVGINGQLRVCGVNLCNQYGRPIQLRGMSSHGIQWFGNCYNPASLDALATDWRSDLFRIAMYVQEQGYETDPAGFTNRVNNLVDEATRRGMYAMIDFHTLTPGDPMFNLERAKTFFAAVSARHASKNNVIYEITNEPNGVSWSTIKNYAEQVIPVIRANDPDAVIIVGTRAWSSLGVSEGSNHSEIANNPVNASNIMYAFHFYAASHKDNYRAEVERAAARLPLFVTEFGTVDYTGDGAADLASSTQWLDLLDRLKIGYANWTFSDKAEGSAALRPGTCNGSNYTGTSVLTASGTFMRERIRTPDNFPTS
ncbi:endoglucanase [Micromonospora phaseoli]|uniref:Endoglucanase n=1 Tax=Micromonospora phaseoli TaxID=1144548 RepID=A0A1H6V981_9ACTN|nr:cellulase family glycosylhydrolase [Micromonospora phaseoli]PZV93679.1 endoglucanase [Micromonospora phaseoli]GIJ79159.1 endoglucanase [Micromonospora phaseoli]SEJ00386.1 endoglucanase [Micromonospora phaseoli]